MYLYASRTRKILDTHYKNSLNGIKSVYMYHFTDKIQGNLVILDNILYFYEKEIL